MTPLCLTLVAVGKGVSRYLIMNQHEHYWTGSAWSQHQAAGLVFYDIQSAANLCQELMIINHSTQSVRRFVAPVVVDVFSDEPLTREQVIEWLVKAARLTVNMPDHGNGPGENTLGLCRIDWSQISEGGET